MTRTKYAQRLAAALVAVGLVSAGCASSSGNRDLAIVTTTNGAVRGSVAAEHRTFQGIPYAAPPVGELRWASPQPARPWSATRDATVPGNACAQNAGFIGEKYSDSEDCLYLNVTTPVPVPKQPLPVMVWIHGSGFAHGSGSIYDARRLATTGDVVVVTVNYRLGIFGFLAHPALDAEQPSGNFGLEDQQAALRWVKSNAAAFGGDPDRVTVFGESAGGVSACSHLVSPASANLFQRAIIQSGPCTATWTDTEGNWLPRSREEARWHSVGVADLLGCSDPATAPTCLRGKSTTELLPQSNYGWGPVFGGGGALPLSPEQAITTGRFNHTPVLNGMTRDEHRMFVAGAELQGRPPYHDADYPREIEAIFGADRAQRIVDRYPLRDYGSMSLAVAAVVTDGIWAASAGQISHLLAEQVPTYSFEFADDRAPWVQTVPAPTFPTGAYHAAELQYLFTVDYFTGQLSDPQKQLSDTMIRYWAQFARTGDPNGPATPPWPRAGSAPSDTQSLAPDTIGPTAFAREHHLNFWRTLG